MSALPPRADIAQRHLDIACIFRPFRISIEIADLLQSNLTYAFEEFCHWGREKRTLRALVGPSQKLWHFAHLGLKLLAIHSAAHWDGLMAKTKEEGAARPASGTQRTTRRILIVGELSKDTLNALRSSEMSPRHEHLNSLLDD
jgi:hypothetical protein